MIYLLVKSSAGNQETIEDALQIKNAQTSVLDCYNASEQLRNWALLNKEEITKVNLILSTVKGDELDLQERVRSSILNKLMSFAAILLKTVVPTLNIGAFTEAFKRFLLAKDPREVLLNLFENELLQISSISQFSKLL